VHAAPFGTLEDLVKSVIIHALLTPLLEIRLRILLSVGALEFALSLLKEEEEYLQTCGVNIMWYNLNLFFYILSSALSLHLPLTYHSGAFLNLVNVSHLPSLIGYSIFLKIEDVEQKAVEEGLIENLISILAKIENNPDDKDDLVMGAFGNLQACATNRMRYPSYPNQFSNSSL